MNTPSKKPNNTQLLQNEESTMFPGLVRNAVLIVLGVVIGAVTVESYHQKTKDIGSNVPVSVKSGTDQAMSQLIKQNEDLRSQLIEERRGNKGLRTWVRYLGKQTEESALVIEDDILLSQCRDIESEKNLEKADGLIAELNIRNKNDIDAIHRAASRGFTRIDFIAANGTHLALIKEVGEDDPNYTGSSFDIELEEPIEAPEKYAYEDEDKPSSPEEKIYKEIMKNEGPLAVISKYDMDSIDFSSEENPEAAKNIESLFRKVQGDLKNAKNDSETKEAACRFMVKVMQELEKFDDNGEELNHDSKKIIFFIETISALSGMDDIEDCVFVLANSPECG